MSALGQKQTFAEVQTISALPPKADIKKRCWDVRFVPKADIQELRDLGTRSPRPNAATLTEVLAEGAGFAQLRAA